MSKQSDETIYYYCGTCNWIYRPGESCNDPEDFCEPEEHCERCDDEGWILVCCDDLCHGSGNPPGQRCIHGDGEKLCPSCHGRNAW